ncbi:MAG: hypothetical protein Kow0092_40300 [Deferrisomatales bacterium]
MAESATHVSNPELATFVGAERYLTFRIGGELYGFEILKVQEIIGNAPTTPVPRSPEFVRGVINLRGAVIPVVDLRAKFGLAPAEDGPTTCIVVVRVPWARNQAAMGILVDDVPEVKLLGEGQVEPAPEFASGVAADYLVGVGKLADRMVMLLDIDRVLSEVAVGPAEVPPRRGEERRRRRTSEKRAAG